VRCTDGLDLLADPVVPVCCFRLVPKGSGDGDALTTAVAVNNFTTREEHVDALVDAVLRARPESAA